MHVWPSVIMTSSLKNTASLIYLNIKKIGSLCVGESRKKLKMGKANLYVAVKSAMRRKIYLAGKYANFLFEFL